MFHVEHKNIKLKKLRDHTPIIVKDFLVTGESFELIYDATYKCLKTSPQPKSEELWKYYESVAYISHTDVSKGALAWTYQMVKKYSLSKKLRLITSFNRRPGKLLDVGAGTGSFLSLAKKFGWKVQGVEPNASARGMAFSKDLDLVNDLESLSGQTYDVVTLWHVLEHIPDLKQAIVKLEELVRPGGHLIIAVPNYRSYDANYYKKFWAAYDAPRHLWHFSQDSMKVLFSQKMLLTKTLPLIFDSFYVSLLSEKYKSGTVFSLKALIIGLWSNILAWQSKEYSSLIYCFKKTN